MDAQLQHEYELLNDTLAQANGHAVGVNINVEPLPVIGVSNRPLRDQTTDALAALQVKNDPPFLFLRSNALSRIVHDEHGRPVIEEVGEAALRGYLTRSAEFLSTKSIRGKVTETHCLPPLAVVQDILSLEQRPFPALSGIVECPVLRPDGTILDIPGYDTATRLFYEPTAGLTVPAIPQEITQQAAKDALDYLHCELLSDFPFSSPNDIANMLACLLTPIVRPAINGCVPLCLLDKPGPGSGATLLSDLVATIATGDRAAKEMIPEGKGSESEWRKKITAILIRGNHVVVFDNIEDSLASACLSAVLTTALWQDRILGESRNITLPVRTTWIATANNISLKGDIARRCYRVRIDPQQERPWMRDGFKHPDLLGWVDDNRGALLAALLTVARAWYVAGQPSADTPKLGGFEQWTRIIGGILAYAGVEGFLANLEELYSMVEEEGPQWGAFLEVWHELTLGRPVTVKELAELARTRPRMLDALSEIVAWDPERPESSSKRLAKALKKHVDRIYAGYRLEQAGSDTHAKVARWLVRKQEK